MKNKIRKNWKKVTALVSAVAITVTTTACGWFKPKNEEPVVDMNEYAISDSLLNSDDNDVLFVIDDELVSIEDLRLMDEVGNIVEEVDAVIKDGEMMSIDNPLYVKLNADDDESLVIDNKIIPESDFTIVKADTKEDVADDITAAYVDGKLVDFELSNDGTTLEDTKEEDSMDDLTEEEFYEKVDYLYNKYANVEKLDLDFNEVESYTLFGNMYQVVDENIGIRDSLVNDRSEDVLSIDYLRVVSAICTENNYRFCSQGLGADSLIMISDAIIDEESRQEVIKFEERFKEIVSAHKDSKKVEELVKALIKDTCDAKKSEFKFRAGVSDVVLRVYFDFIRTNFQDILPADVMEDLQYLNSNVEDEDKYFLNSESTGSWGDLMVLLSVETEECEKEKKLILEP